jgi:hypothetical protein
MPQLTGPRLGRPRLAASICLSLLAGRAIPGEAQDASPDAGGKPAPDSLIEPDSPPQADTDLFASEKDEPLDFAQFWNDPTLGGRLHLTYRASVIGRIFDFKKYEYPFPGEISDADREQAEQLAQRHDDTWDCDINQYFSLTANNL